jgi:peptidoglycan/xylan/chitin deacetylase (PgdA/CDA1 family)
VFKNKTEESLTIPVAAFKQQLDWMAANGYHVISMEDAYAGMVLGKPLPSKPVVLTFDDGAPDAYTNVYPILSQRGLSGTFFIIAKRVDERVGLNWAKVREMSAAGMVIASHTMTHANLSSKTPEQINYELQASKALIERNISRPVHFFAYPFGSVSPAITRQVKQAGYEAAFTTHEGYWKPGDNPIVLKRVRVNRSAKAVPLLKDWTLVN